MGSVLPSDNCTSCEFLCEAVSVNVATSFVVDSGLSPTSRFTLKVMAFLTHYLRSRYVTLRTLVNTRCCSSASLDTTGSLLIPTHAASGKPSSRWKRR